MERGRAVKVHHYLEVEAKTEENLPGVTVRWVITEEDGAPNFVMRIFEVEPRAHTPFHTHPWEHEIFVLEGSGVVRGEGEERKISPGDVVLILPEERHQLINDEEKLLRFICLIPLEDEA